MEIRKYKIMGYTTDQICEMLKLPKGTYWYYMKVIHAEDREAYEEHLKVAICHEVMSLKEKLSILEQRATELFNQSTDTSEKIDIIRLIKEIAVEKVQIDYEGPDLIYDNNTQTTTSKVEEKENKYKHN